MFRFLDFGCLLQFRSQGIQTFCKCYEYGILHCTCEPLNYSESRTHKDASTSCQSMCSCELSACRESICSCSLSCSKSNSYSLCSKSCCFKAVSQCTARNKISIFSLTDKDFSHKSESILYSSTTWLVAPVQEPCSILYSEGCGLDVASIDPVNCCPILNSTLTEGNQIIDAVLVVLDESPYQKLPDLEDLKLKENEELEIMVMMMVFMCVVFVSTSMTMSREFMSSHSPSYWLCRPLP